MESTLRRTWAEVNLDAIEYNYRKIREKIGPDVKFLGVVKADAYGHGSVIVARTLQENGADYLAVSSIDEATELRMLDNLMKSDAVRTCVIITHRSATAAICSRQYQLVGTTLREVKR